MTGTLHKIGSGMNGAYVYMGMANFAAAGVTFELDVPFKRIDGYDVSFAGAPAAAESGLSINEALVTDPNGKKFMRRDEATGGVTVTRSAGTTAGIGFSFIIWGK